jgi:hypothetical protein
VIFAGIRKFLQFQMALDGLPDAQLAVNECAALACTADAILAGSVA